MVGRNTQVKGSSTGAMISMHTRFGSSLEITFDLIVSRN